MDRNQKKNEIASIKNEIIDVLNKIKLEAKILNELKNIYIAEAESELPVLFYLADESLDDDKYEYLYYLADTDEIISVFEDKPDKYLPNTVNMLNFFERSLPIMVWPGDIRQYNNDEVQESLSTIKQIINNIFELNDINSWEEVRKILNLNINGIDCGDKQFTIIRKK